MKGVETHVAGKKSLLPINVVDKAVIKVSSEPLLGAVASKQFIDQGLEVLVHHWAVLDDVLGFYKAETVVEKGCSSLHTHLVGFLVKLADYVFERRSVLMKGSPPVMLVKYISPLLHYWDQFI